MLKKTIIYIKLWILFQLFVEISCQIKPLERKYHTATLIDNKLYILGGGIILTDSAEKAGKEFFYLDVSVAFNTQKLFWQDLSNVNTVPSHIGATAVKGGANNNTIFLYGGTDTVPTLVYIYDPQSNSWSIPKIGGYNIHEKKRYMKGVIDTNEKMYIWGGSVVGGTNSDMFILDTINLRWGIGNLIGAPTPRSEHGAILLPNNNIMYMGGYYHDYLPLNQVYFYNIINDNWSTENTLGNIPSSRTSFSVVLGLDGQNVIIFGGNIDTESGSIPPGESLYVLNLNNFEWSVPKISGPIPNSRNGHQANVIGVYMVISFGSGYDRSVESDILLLDIRNNNEYTWTYNFDPLATPITPAKSETPVTSMTPAATPVTTHIMIQQSSNNQPAMIGAIIGSLFGGILLSFGGFFLYKWNKNKKKQKNIMPTPGNENHDNYDREVTLITTEKNIHNHGQEFIQIPKNENTTNHELITNSVINKDSNHGQEAIINENPSIQNISDNVLENLKNEMIQAVRQEIMQNLKETIQNNE
ncbi:hypothetical protein RclHR1_01630021 [Rhizophagus clarus]|nr:hypothetical protein RclHR1_01630021 [Rhizophagus clarus]